MTRRTTRSCSRDCGRPRSCGLASGPRSHGSQTAMSARTRMASATRSGHNDIMRWHNRGETGEDKECDKRECQAQCDNQGAKPRPSCRSPPVRAGIGVMRVAFTGSDCKGGEATADPEKDTLDRFERVFYTTDVAEIRQSGIGLAGHPDGANIKIPNFLAHCITVEAQQVRSLDLVATRCKPVSQPAKAPRFPSGCGDKGREAADCHQKS